MTVAEWRTATTTALTSLQDGMTQLLAGQGTIAAALTDLSAAAARNADAIAYLRTAVDQLAANDVALERKLDQVLELLQPPVDPPPPPAPGCQFGALAGILKGSHETKEQARARVSAEMGGSLAVERIYLEDGQWDPALVDVGHSVICSWAFRDLAGLAAGAYSARITAFARAWTGPGRLYMAPNHEPDQAERPYTAAQFAAGARPFVAAVKAAGNPAVSTTVILMSWSLHQGDDWKAFYDGVDVDVLGWDAYWRPTLPNTPQDVYGPCSAAAAAFGKPWVLGETSMGAQGNLGSTDRTLWIPIEEDTWTSFIGGAVDYLADPTHGCAAAAFFETNLVAGDGRLVNHPAALARWAAAVQASPRQ